MWVTIYCSGCGNRRRLSTKRGTTDAYAAYAAGWTNRGNGFYCPKCSRERNIVRIPSEVAVAILAHEVRWLESIAEINKKE